MKNVKNFDPNIIQMVGEPIIDCEIFNKKSGLGLIFTFETYVNKKIEQIKLEALEFDKISIQEEN